MIPLRLSPLPWEQLGGYYLRAAGLLSCRVRDLIAAATAPHRRTFDLAGFSAFPPSETIAATQRTFGLSAEAVAAMTLRRFKTDLFGQSAVPITAGADADAPALLGGSLYCPKCVKAGLWDLRWKTALAAVCLRHGSYLRARCPSCARVFAPDTLTPPEEGSAEALVHGGRGCTAALVGPTVQAADPHLRDQRRLFETLEQAQTDPAAAATCRDVLRWAEYLHRSLSDRTFIAGGMVALAGPALSDLLNASLELALRREVGGDVHPVLRRAIDAQRAKGRPPNRAPHYAPLLSDSHDRVPQMISDACMQRRLPAFVPGPGFAGCADALPQVMPVSEFVPAISDPLHLCTYDRARVVAAISLAAPHGRPHWSEVGLSLGLTPAVGRNAGQTLALLEDTGAADEYWDAIGSLRERIQGLGIDFRARAVAVRGDDVVYASALAKWPSLRRFPRNVVQQWLLDRWACQHIRLGGWNGRGGRVSDHRATVDAAVGRPEALARLWEWWDPSSWLQYDRARDAAG